MIMIVTNSLPQINLLLNFSFFLEKLNTNHNHNNKILKKILRGLTVDKIPQPTHLSFYFLFLLTVS